MTPRAITLRRFGSFLEEQTFEFPRGPGLYFMRGRNELNPRMGGNACGKSTLLARALTWVLFGKDPRGMKAGAVANWSAPKGAMVQLDFEHGAKAWAVRREHAPNSWRLRLPEDVLGPDGPGCWIDLAAGEDQPLSEMLRMDFPAWLGSVVLAQRGDMFLDMQPSDRAALFSSALGLEKWSAYSERAARRAEVEDEKMRDAEWEEAGISGRLSQVEKFDPEAEREWDEDRRRKLAGINADYERLLVLERTAKQALVRAEEALPGLQAELRGALEEQEEASQRLKSSEDDAAVDATALAVAVERATQALQASRRAQESRGRCPECGQAIDITHLAELSERVEKAQEVVDGAALALKLAKERLGQAKERARRLARIVQEARSGLEQGVRACSDSRRSHEAAGRELDRLEDEADRIQNERNPHADIRERNDRAAAELRGRLDEVRRVLDQSAAQREKFRFWVRGFKDIRLQQIAGALDELSIGGNSALAALGLSGWELIFEVDRETASGSVQRGFSVLVRSPHNELRVPWEAWSGGEAQRLRVAAQMGLSDLTRDRSGADFPLEVWDEPTDGMSGPGIEDLLQALRDRAHSAGRQVWVVDHRALGFGGFDGAATVVLDGGGSRVTWEAE